MYVTTGFCLQVRSLRCANSTVLATLFKTKQKIRISSCFQLLKHLIRFYSTTFVFNDVIIKTNKDPEETVINEAIWHSLPGDLSVSRRITHAHSTYRIFFFISERNVQDLRYREHGHVRPLPSNASLPSQQPTSWSNRDLWVATIDWSLLLNDRFPC